MLHSSVLSASGPVSAAGINLRDSQFLDVAADFLKSFDEITQENPNLTVREFFALHFENRARFASRLKALRPTLDPVLRPLLDDVLKAVPFSEKIQEKIQSVIERYGHGRIPDGPVPLPDSVYEIWRPRFQELGGLTSNMGVFGGIGELALASSLPEVVAVRTGPHQLLSPKEQARFVSRLNPEEAEWLSRHSRSTFEIDIVYEGGTSLAEVKFFKNNPDPGSRVFEKLERQAEKLGRLRQLFLRQGIERNFNLIVVGISPSPEIQRVVSLAGLGLVHLPYDFKSLTVPSGQRLHLQIFCNSIHLR